MIGGSAFRVPFPFPGTVHLCDFVSHRCTVPGNYGRGLTGLAPITFGLALEAGSVIVRPVVPVGLWRG